MITSANFLLNIMITIKKYTYSFIKLFFSSFQKSLAHLGLELHHLHLCLRQPAHDFSSASVCRFHSFSKDTVGFRALPDPVWLHLKYICIDSVSKIRPHSGVNRIWIWGFTTEPTAVGKVLKMEGTSARRTGGTFRQNSDAGSSV